MVLKGVAAYREGDMEDDTPKNAGSVRKYLTRERERQLRTKLVFGGLEGS